MKRNYSLEKEALKLCKDSAKPPLIFQIPPEEGRKKLNELQDAPVYMYPAEIESLVYHSSEWGSFRLYCIRPEKMKENPNIIFYIHGAGWVFGNFHTHEKLVRELSHRTNSIVIFPEYSLSPEAKYPTAVEQCYEAICNLSSVLAQVGWSGNLGKLTVAGDSVGGNMATVMTILSKYRKGPHIDKQLLYYPVTNAYFNTKSYNLFATDYYLYRDGMIWFWDQYTTSERDRCSVTASPLLASLEELKGLPPAMVINGQCDVLRSEGESYANRLRESGVDVTAIRFQAMVHDFVMLHALDQTKACRSAMDASVQWINRLNQQLKL